MQFSVDLRDYTTPGTYDLPVTVDLPDGITLDEQVTVRLTLVEKTESRSQIIQTDQGQESD